MRDEDFEVCPPLHALVGRSRATVGELLAARVSASADALFLRSGDQSWTYGEAWETMRRFAGLLAVRAPREHTVGRVATYLGNCPEAVFAWLGCAVAGRVVVPLNRAHRGAMLIDMLRRSRADVLVTDAEGLAAFEPVEGSDVRLAVLVGDDPAEPPDAFTTLPWNAVAGYEPVTAEYGTPSDTAEVLFTSGTTGRSKAVLLSHNQICRGAGWVAWSLDLGADDVLHAWPPIFHVAAQIDGILPMVVGGGAAALYPTFTRSGFWTQVEESRATVFIGFANVLEWLSQLDPRPDDAGSTLRAGIVGAVPAALARSFSERFGVRLHDSYGMTEVEPIAIPPPDGCVPPGAWGPPRPDLEVAVLDEDDVVLSVGATGQIAVRPRVPDVVTRGYEDDADATLAVMRNLWFHTGDLGRFDEDGNLWFVDRMHHAIRRRGENISSWEIEQLLLAHPAIDECCAVGIPDGHGEEDVLVAIVEAAGTEVELASLREWCAARMAHFMVPRFAVVVDELPRTPVAKVIKQEIPHLPGRIDLCAVATGAPDC